MKVRLMIIIVSILLCSTTYAATTEDVQQPDDATKPLISKRVEQSLLTEEKVLVMIKVREAGAPPFAMKWANATDPSKNISKRDIKKLQNRLKSAFSAKELENDIKIVHELHTIPWVSAYITEKALAKLRKHPNVAMVTANVTGRDFLAESSPLISGNVAYDAGYTGQGVTVAVLDSGIDTDHPMLQDNLIGQHCYLPAIGSGCPPDGHGSSESDNAEDDRGHGTHVSGIITSSDPVYRGIADGANIVAVKVTDVNGHWNVTDLIQGVDWIINNNQVFQTRIINMSLGSNELFSPSDHCGVHIPFMDDDPYVPLRNAIVGARNLGIITFASSGNNGVAGQMTAPACIPEVVSVGSVYDADVGIRSQCKDHDCVDYCVDYETASDKIVCNSNATEDLDLLAPGAMIISAALGGGLSGEWSGTSMASPHAAATAALLIEKNPDLTPDDIEAILKSTGTSVYDPDLNQFFPRINAADALSAADDLAVSPIYHDFGSIAVWNGSPIQSFVVSNNRSSALNIGQVEVTGPDADDFIIVNENCSYSNITTGSCQIDVVLSPLSSGSKSANITIPSDDPHSPTLVPLRGEGHWGALVPIINLLLQ